MITKPMLAGSLKELTDVRYPVACTPKIDGIRCLKIDGKVVSRNFKPIPNQYIRTMLERLLENGMDGEIVSGTTFQDVTSNIMTQAGKPDFKYCLFDWVKTGTSLEDSYIHRIFAAKTWLEKRPSIKEYITLLYPELIHNEEQLLNYEKKCLKEGYEGVMLRSASGPYKCGRSTVKEGYLLKLKRFEDSEAEIIGFEELLHNANEAKTDVFGHTERSSHKANMIGKGTLGSIQVKDLKTGIEFSIGTGFDQETRDNLWKIGKGIIGKIVKYKYFPTGIKEAPRFPTWLGFRDKDDT